VIAHLFYQRRPAGYPLVITALGHDRERVVLFQRALGALSWVCLALACARRLHSPSVQCLAALSIVALGCSPMVIWWDINLISESIAISVFVLLIALLLSWDSRKRPVGGLTGLILTTFFFSMMRATNIYILPAISLYLVLVEIRAWSVGLVSSEWARHRGRIIARFCLIGALIASFPFFHRENIVSGRWKFEVMDSLNRHVFFQELDDGRRIVRRQYFDFFVDHYQMPADEAMAHVGRWRWEKPAEPTPLYDAWVSERGYGAYLDFLKSHMKWVMGQYCAIGRLYSINGGWLVSQWEGWRKGFDIRQLDTLFWIQSFYLKTVGLLTRLGCAFIIMIGMAIALALWWVHLLKQGEDASVCPELVATLAVMFYCALIIAFISWFAAGGEQWRHSIVGVVSYYAGATMLAWGLLDRVVGYCRTSTPQRGRPSICKGTGPSPDTP